MKPHDDELQDVMERLQLLSPGAADAPRPARRALAAVRQRIAAAPASRRRHSWRRHSWRRMATSPGRRLAMAVASLVLVLGLAFSFPAVRAMASDFLGLFRVQKFAAISISAEQLAMLQRVAEEGIVPGEIEVVAEPQPARAVSTVGDAARAADMDVRRPHLLGYPDTIRVMTGGAGRLVIDVDGARAILESAGGDPALLPDQLDGQAVEVTLFASVEQRWDEHNTWLVQTESPIVRYPDGLDPVALGQATLQLLGLNEVEAARLARDIDWTSTLLLPIPRDMATFTEVTVNGGSGLALTSVDGRQGAIIWQQKGVLYVLNGSRPTAELLRMANSVK